MAISPYIEAFAIKSVSSVHPDVLDDALLVLIAFEHRSKRFFFIYSLFPSGPFGNSIQCVMLDFPVPSCVSPERH